MNAIHSHHVVMQWELEASINMIQLNPGTRVISFILPEASVEWMGFNWLLSQCTICNQLPVSGFRNYTIFDWLFSRKHLNCLLRMTL